MRIARQHVPGVVHHLIWRFVDSRWFLDLTGARTRYLRLLGRSLLDSDWKCLAFALMSNHIHLAVLAGRSPLEEWSRRVNLPFATWINEKQRRIGPVFADRAKDHAFGPAGVPALIGYLHNNPVRASVVDRAANSTWTSHRAYIGESAVPKWLHVSLGLEVAGLEREHFDEFVDGHPAMPERPRPKAVLRAVREFGQVNAATPFERQVPLVIRPFGRLRPDPRRVIQLVCAQLGLDARRVASRQRDRELHRGRVAVIHCAVAVGITGSDIASALGISQQTVSRIVRYAARPSGVCEEVHAQLQREIAVEVSYRPRRPT